MVSTPCSPPPCDLAAIDLEEVGFWGDRPPRVQPQSLVDEAWAGTEDSALVAAYLQ